LRISCPPTISPCFYGVDTPSKNQLIAANKSVDEIRQYIGADSLAYLSLDGMKEACAEGLKTNYCTACYTGLYPTEFVDVNDVITGVENLEMIGRLYHLSAHDARRRALELLVQFDLTDAANRMAKTYSGGMRRRLDLAASLVILPPVLFLDEPTSGLDPRSRRQMWGVISSLVAEGSTILLTTQYLEEADELASRIAVVDSGRVIAEGTSDDLKTRVGGDRIEVAVARNADLSRAADIARRHLSGEVTIDGAQRRLSGPSADGTSQLASLVRDFDAAGIEITDLQLHRPSLDDVFLTLTGHEAEREKTVESGRGLTRRAS